MKFTHKKKAMTKNARPCGLRQPMNKNEATSKKLMKALTMEPAKSKYLKEKTGKRLIAEASKTGLTAIQKMLEQEDYNDENYHEEVYGPYDEEACQEETYEEGYDDEAYDGYDDGTYEQEEGYDDEPYEQEDWYGDEAYQDQDQEQDWYGDETYQDQETEWYGDEAETYEEDTNQYGQCIFFDSPEGCRRGNECKYRHDCDPNTGEPLPASSKNRKRYRQSCRREQGQEVFYKEREWPTVGRPQELHPMRVSVALWCDILYKDVIHEKSIYGLIVARCNFLPGEKIIQWLEWIDVAVSMQLSIKTSYWKSWWLH